MYDFDDASGSWSQRGGFIDGGEGDWSGEIVRLSDDGTVLAVSARNNDAYRGCARVYKWRASEGQWGKRGGDINGAAANDRAGAGLAMNAAGSIIGVGSSTAAGAAAAQRGGHARAFAFDFGTGQWV